MGANSSPIALATITGRFFVTVAVRCNLDNLRDPRNRYAVTAIDRANQAMVVAAGGYLQCFPPSRDVSRDPTGYVFRVLTVAARPGYERRLQRMFLAACMSLEGDGYDVTESTEETRIVELVNVDG